MVNTYDFSNTSYNEHVKTYEYITV